MISIVASLVISILVQSGATREPWVADLLQTKEAQAILSAHAKLPTPPPGRAIEVPPQPGEDSGHLKFLPIPGLDRAEKETYALIEEGRYEDAAACISRARKDHPEYEAWTIDLAIEAELLGRSYESAYKDAVVRVATGGFSGEDQNLYISLASAAKGQVFPGQAQYCATWIERHLKNHGLPVPTKLTFEARTSRDLMVLSAIALGTKAEPGFLELALRLDPVNELAARQAIRYYEAKGRYSDLRRIASGLVDRLPPGENRDFYVKAVSSAADLKDRPLHAVINP